MLSHSSLSFFFFFHCYVHLRDLHSFPTRRSSDLFILSAGDLDGMDETRCVTSTASAKNANSRWVDISDRTFSFRGWRSEEHTSELQSRGHLVCRLLLEKKKKTARRPFTTSSDCD